MSFRGIAAQMCWEQGWFCTALCPHLKPLAAEISFLKGNCWWAAVLPPLLAAQTSLLLAFRAVGIQPSLSPDASRNSANVIFGDLKSIGYTKRPALIEEDTELNASPLLSFLPWAFLYNHAQTTTSHPAQTGRWINAEPCLLWWIQPLPAQAQTKTAWTNLAPKL